MVKAQGGARHMSMVPNCVNCEHGRPLSSELSEEAPVPRPPAKKRRAQLGITFHKAHLLRTYIPQVSPSSLKQQAKARCLHFTSTTPAPVTPPSSHVASLNPQSCDVSTESIDCCSRCLIPVPEVLNNDSAARNSLELQSVPTRESSYAPAEPPFLQLPSYIFKCELG